MGHVVKMVMRGLDAGEGDLERYRSILRRFVAPAFVGSDAPSPHLNNDTRSRSSATIMRG